MSRFWASWYEPMPDGDWRPLAVPDAASCAVVDAADEPSARAVIQRHWRPFRYRFVDEKPADWLPGERFPMSRP